MKILKTLFSKPVEAVDLLQQISKRAEDLTPEEQAKSFVSIRRIDGALKSRDSRIIFGRRGTGKTHILSYVANTVTAKGGLAISIDLRTLGSNNSIYSDRNLDAGARATRLVRDLISTVHEKLLERITDPRSKYGGKAIEHSLDKLANCVKTILISETQQVRRQTASDRSVKAELKGSGQISPTTARARASAGLAASYDDHNKDEVTVNGEPRLSVNMGDAASALTDIAQHIDGRIWLLLDEWSSLPEDLQPYLADFVRRAILPIQNISVVIAAIEFRSVFRIDFDNYRVGFELGSDISADINLDDYFVYDVSAQTAVDFFKSLLFQHLEAFAGDQGLKESSPSQVVNSIFSQDRVFAELVRASEGVARDFINILQLAAMRSDQTKISMNEIRTAAKDWFERDKQRNLDTNKFAQSLLHWIRDEVIDRKRARAFLLRTDTSDPTIEFLFDERMLHIARRSYSAQDEPGVRYQVWKVDYGCYVDLINTVKSPTGFLFEGMEISDTGNIEVPDDDYRSVRRAVLELRDFYESSGYS
ncbi:ORC-CDC6 family AAA ATPase [Ruegeria arenilitoris]|uniref:ORC-CDC6 family AAA ATPase n=1 Tax=Ruegeria arenilitoris TaxID=1173585 RepID=UPI00147FFDC1|nr:hypothetical protein [Ruegeria arenilitoris]